MDEKNEINRILKEAQAAYQRGEFLNAAQLFEAAESSCLAADDRLAAAEMANNASVAYLQAGDAQTAWDKAQGTDELFAQAGDKKRQAIALGNQGAALEVLQKFDQSRDCYERSADLLKDAHEPELRASVLKSLSALQLRRGSQLEALASMNAALANQKKLSFKEKMMKKLLQVPFKMLNR
jgi:tetratricopeptide (TPR) repeat protein